MSATASTFDLDGLKDAIERRDVAGQLALYAPDAEVSASSIASRRPGARACCTAATRSPAGSRMSAAAT